MGSDKTRLLRELVEAKWLAVFAMPVQNNRKILLDMVFETPQIRIRFVGKDHILADGSEAFSLAIQQYVQGGWWKLPGQGISSDWVPKNVKEELSQNSRSELLSPPRNVQFFCDPVLEQRISKNGEILDNCAAIQLSKRVEGSTIRIVLAASKAYPCALEYAQTELDCNGLIYGLMESDVLTSSILPEE